MDFKGWGLLDTRQWWLAVLLISGPLLIASGTTGHITAALIAGGVTIWDFGEWAQHPYQKFGAQFGRDLITGDVYRRVWSGFGLILNIVGIFVVCFALYRFWRLGGRVL